MKRENRYEVIKLSKLTDDQRTQFYGMLFDLKIHPLNRALIVENDWPEYEPTWAAIEARVDKDVTP